MRRAWMICGAAFLLVACSGKKPTSSGAGTTAPAAMSTPTSTSTTSAPTRQPVSAASRQSGFASVRWAVSSSPLNAPARVGECW